MSSTNPPRFKPFFSIYGSLGKKWKNKGLPFWWYFLESLEIFLREYSIMIIIMTYHTILKNGVMVIEKNGDYHNTSQ